MKVLLVTPAFFPHRSGVVTQVSKLAKALRNYNYSVEILTAYPKFIGSSSYQDIPVHYSFSISPNKQYIFSPALIATFVRRKDFDLVHAWDYQSFPSHFIALSKFLFHAKIPFCFSPQYHMTGGTLFRTGLRFALKSFGDFAFRVANKVICISHYELNNLLKCFTIERGKLEVIPLGIDLDETKLTNSCEPKEYLQLLYVGRLERYKGVHLLLSALSLLKKGDVRLSIVGDGPFKNELEKLKRKLHLEKRVSFLGHVSDMELDRIYRESDVFVLPSIVESFGLVISEAMSYGKTIISTNVGFMYDICLVNRLQRRLLLSMPPTSKEIADRIRFVLQSPGLTKEIAYRNLQILRSKYSWKEVGEKINKTYTQLTTGHN